jgi:hypothetical protein
MNVETPRPCVGGHRLILLPFFAVCPHIGSQADRCVDRIGGGEGVLRCCDIDYAFILSHFKIFIRRQ